MYFRVKYFFQGPKLNVIETSFYFIGEKYSKYNLNMSMGKIVLAV